MASSTTRQAMGSRACSHFQATTIGANCFGIQSARSQQRMSSGDGRQPDRGSGLSSRVEKAEGSPLTAPSNVPCTIKEVARLAEVSIATVSRVTSRSNDVSSETAAKVLAAVSQLQYRPNAAAAELARGKGRNPRVCGAHRPAMAGTKATPPSYSGALARDKRSWTGLIPMLENE
jgi:hypothetical protein